MIRKTTKFIFILLSGLLLYCAPHSCYAQNKNDSKTNLTPMTAETYLHKTVTLNKDKTRTVEKWKKYKCYKGKIGNLTRDFCILEKDAGKSNAELISRGTGVFGGKRKGCEVISVAWYNSKGCLFCSMLRPVYKATDLLTDTSFRVFSTSFASLIVIIFVIWIAIKTLSQVSSLTTQDISKHLNTIMVQGFKFLIAYFALYNYKWLFDTIIIPIFVAGLEFATAFVDTGSNHDANIDRSLLKNNQLFTTETYMYLEGFAREVNMQFSLLQTIGKSLRCLGGKFLTGFDVWQQGINLGLGLNCIIYGLMFGLIGFLLSLGFVFYLFDAVVELGMFGAVLPFAIACWPFKLFTKTAGTAIKLFMNCTFTFMLAGVAVRVCVGLISSAIGGGGDGKDLSALVTAADMVDTNSLKDMVGVINVSFLIFIFAGFSGFLFMSRIPAITGLFASGGMKGNASGIATMGADSVKKTAKKVAKPTAKAIGNSMNKGASKLMGKIANSKIGRATNKVATAAGKVAVAGGAAVAIGAVAGAPVLAGVAAAAAVGKIVSARRKSKKSGKKQTT